MKFGALVIFILFAPRLQSQDLGISIGSKQELILTQSTCADLLAQQTALCEWTKNLDPNFIIPKPKKCESVAKNKFRIVISECLPKFTKTNQQKRLWREGPNCWGTAMSLKELTPTPRFMWPEELHYWMDGPLCRKLLPNEPKLPGDIINIYGPEKLTEEEKTAQDPGTEFWKLLYPNRSRAVSVDLGIGYTGYHKLLHSVTYVSDQLAFGKDSPSELDRFYFHSMNEVYGRPRKEEMECQEDQNLSPHLREYENLPRRIHGKKCSYFSLAYRCENIKNYFNSIVLDSHSQATLENIKTIHSLQMKLWPLVTDAKVTLKKDDITLMLELSNVTVMNARQKLQQPLNKDQEMLSTLEYFSAHALRKSLQQSKLIPPEK